MKSHVKLRKTIYSDCFKAVIPASVFYLLSDILGGILEIYTSDILGNFADSVFSLDFSYGLSNFLQLIICCALAVFFVPVVTIIGEVLMFSNALKHDRIVQSRFFDKTYQSIASVDVGEIQYRLEDDPINLRGNYIDIVVKSATIPIILIYLLNNTLKISVLYTIIIFAVSMFKLIVPVMAKKLQTKYDKQTREYNTRVRAYETEFTKNAWQIKLFGLSKMLIKRLDSKYYEYYNGVYRKNVKCLSVADNILSFLDTFCMFLILFVGAFIISTGRISAGDVVAMTGYFAVLNGIIQNIDFIIKNIPIIKNTVDRMELLYEEAEEQGGESIDAIYSIEANNLSFSYAEEPIFSGLDFFIFQGEKVAIVGANGSGKTTLINLFCGLLKKYMGLLKINNMELSSVSIRDLRRQVAYVTQNPYIFHGSVKENICLGNLSTDSEDVESIIKLLGLEHLAERTEIEGGDDLSGGEKQKISIARALLKDSSVIIFDEPSNNLDEQTVEWLKCFISDTTKTIIAVSHNDNVLSLFEKKIYL